jgi:hypothetical protein
MHNTVKKLFFLLLSEKDGKNQCTIYYYNLLSVEYIALKRQAVNIQQQFLLTSALFSH